MAAAAGASGVRSWLAAHHMTWLTPQRMKAATAALFVAATLMSSIGLSGSSTSVSAHARVSAHAGASAHAGVSAHAASHR